MSADRALLRRPVSGLAADVRAGRLGSKELVGASLAAIDADDGALHAFVRVDAERALADAAAIDEAVARGDELGPLAGVPLAVKDTEDAIGFPTTIGSATRRRVPTATSDSILVARLRAAGAVVVGKTNTPEQAWKGDTTNGWGVSTLNPWNPERSAGGSSGGSAAAVAAGLVPLATASDGGGSIRIPSSVCGLTGFKPSLGRVPSGPAAPGWLDLSSKGILGVRLADAVAALDVAVAPDPTDLRALPAPEAPWLRSLGDAGVPLRVAWSPTLGYVDNLDPEILAVCERAVGLLADLGADVEELPVVFEEDPGLVWFTMVAACNERTLAPLRDTDQWSLVDPGLAQTADLGRAVSGPDVVRAFDTCHAMNRRLVDVFHRCSLLLTPTVAGHTPPAGTEDPGWIRYTYPFNMTRSPAGTVCAGLTADGMPIGLQVVGPQHADVAVLRALSLLESVLAVDTVPPAYP